MAIAWTYTKSTNTAVVTGGTSGTPATFSTFVTADRAGSVTLLAAWAPNSNTKALTYQITPVEKLALTISFVVASKTTETDYCFVTGTAFDDAAQTEAVDVSAGNGTYTTTKKFRTITNIDCSDSATGGGTVWADGTVAVTQPQWGVVWDFGGKQYRVDSNAVIGNGSTSTYFTSLNEEVAFMGNVCPTSLANATIQIGTKVSATAGKDGSIWTVKPDSYNWSVVHFSSRILAYNWTYKQDYTNSRRYELVFDNASNNDEYIDCRFHSWFGCTFSTNPTILSGCAFTDGYGTFANTKVFNITNSATVTLLKPRCIYGGRGLSLQGYAFNAICKTIGFAVDGISTYDLDINNNWAFSVLNYYVINNDASVNLATKLLWESTATANVYEQYLVDINIADKNGANLSSATVLCQDVNSNTVFSVNTDASGNIAQQTVSYKLYYYNSGPGVTTFSPHTFTISKAGYQTLILENITIDHPIVWHLELAGPTRFKVDTSTYFKDDS